jgi:RimJ/RimL family protein N-acetyltransferase
MREPRPLPERFPLPDWLQFWIERNAGKKPLWLFPKLLPSSDLTFERLTFDNRDTVLRMFSADPNPFVSEDFKTAEPLYLYVANHWICAPYSPKNGAADWIIRANGEAAGLLHLYDVSRETWGLNNRRCCIGYTIAEKFRGSGLAQNAVRALQTYAFSRLDMLVLLAIPDRRNERSIRFLQRLGYQENTDAYVEKGPNRFFELFRSPKARRQYNNRFAERSAAPQVNR